MPGIRGIGRSFKLDNAAGVLTDISTMLKQAEPSNSPDEYDGTTYQPGVAEPSKDQVPGFANRSYALNGIWSPAVETHFGGIDGKSGLAFEDGPEGTAAGKCKISGTCSCKGYTGPKPPVDGLITWEATLNVTTRVVGTF
jgi:hypothetical protein